MPFVDSTQILRHFSSPAPLLQSLVITVGPHYSHLPPHEWSFFNGDTPALRRLELSWCSIPQPIPVLHGLTVLILQNPLHLTVAEVKTALGSMQNLVHLESSCAFEQARPGLGGHTLHGSEIVRPPHLLRLAITEPSFAIVQLLSWLDIPPRTTVRITASQLHPRAWLDFRSVLAKRLFSSGDDESSYIRTLAIHVDPARVAIAASKKDDHGSIASHCHQYCDWDWDCNIPLQLSLPIVSWLDTIRNIIQDAHSGGYFTSVRRVHLTVDSSSENRCIFSKAIFSLIPGLRCIELIGGKGATLSRLFSLLSFSPRHHAKSQGPGAPRVHGQLVGTMLAPALEELILRFAGFDHQASDSAEYTGHVSNLYEALAIRKEKGYILNRLTLTGCQNVFKEDVARLKDVATEVVWDGDEREFAFDFRALEEREIQSSSSFDEEDTVSAHEGEGEDPLENGDADDQGSVDEG